MKTATVTVMEHDWCSACFACSGTDGYYPTKPQHDDCTGKCSGNPTYRQPNPPPCGKPCPCKCSEPLSRNEIMELRDLAERLRR